MFTKVVGCADHIDDELTTISTAEKAAPVITSPDRPFILFFYKLLLVFDTSFQYCTQNPVYPNLRCPILCLALEPRHVAEQAVLFSSLGGRTISTTRPPENRTI